MDTLGITATEALANFIAATRYEDLPPQAQERTKVRLLDAIACSVAGHDNVTTQRALALAKLLSQEGPSSYWFSESKGTVQDCAFVNSVMAHSILHEDVGRGGHPGCNVIPAALAVAEAEQRSGADVLAAIALGYELQVRLGSLGLMSDLSARGFRGTTVYGTFGAAAVAAYLYGLEPSVTSQALSFAASLCVPGIEEPLLHGSSERCLHMGANTKNGILCTLLARAGYDGVPTALEGDCGLFAAYGGVAGIPNGFIEDLGTRWSDRELFFKPYPTAGYNTGPIHAAELLIERNGIAVGDLMDTEVRMHAWGRNTGYSFPGPFDTIEQALVSCPFAVATTFVYGAYTWPVVQQALTDPRVDELAGRIKLEEVENWQPYNGEITIRVRDGRVLTEIAALDEAVLWPSFDDEVHKFQKMTAHVMDQFHRDRLVTEVRELERRTDIGSLRDVMSQTQHSMSQAR